MSLCSRCLTGPFVSAGNRPFEALNRHHQGPIKGSTHCCLLINQPFLSPDPHEDGYIYPGTQQSVQSHGPLWMRAHQVN